MHRLTISSPVLSCFFLIRVRVVSTHISGSRFALAVLAAPPAATNPNYIYTSPRHRTSLTAPNLFSRSPLFLLGSSLPTSRGYIYIYAYVYMYIYYPGVYRLTFPHLFSLLAWFLPIFLGLASLAVLAAPNHIFYIHHPDVALPRAPPRPGLLYFLWSSLPISRGLDSPFSCTRRPKPGFVFLQVNHVGPSLFSRPPPFF